MKLLLNLLATVSYGAPEKKKQRKFKNDRTYASSVPLVPCSTTVSDSWEISGGSPFKSFRQITLPHVRMLHISPGLIYCNDIKGCDED